MSPSSVRTLTRALHRYSRPHHSPFAHPNHGAGGTDQRRAARWVNDEQFEVLESGALDEQIPTYEQIGSDELIGTDALILPFRRA